MAILQDESVFPTAERDDVNVEVVIIGAGITGIHQLYRIREAGFSALVIEAGSGVGGTWYWNRYPGARTDSEGYSYGYFFSEELWRDWHWQEHFPSQPQMEAYLNHVVDRFGLRENIRFNARVHEANFDDTTNTWTVHASDGTTVRARFVITATGVLSIPYRPEVPGRDVFRGEQYHTGEWPLEPVDLAGKRVAVIGTGASGVQLIPAIAADVASLTVYQRTPNWIAPLNNAPMTPHEMVQIKAKHGSFYDRVHSTFSGFLHEDNGRHTFDDTPEQRSATYEEIWNDKGHSGLFGNYVDMATSSAANAEFCKFLAEKIRSIVKDPQTADKLVPNDHGFGMKRPPLDAYGYFKAFNQPNVSLVDLRDSPILKVTETGIETKEGHGEFDIIVWATGFDAVTGPLVRMGIKGVGGTSLNEYWSDGPRTYMGLQAPGFPNLLFTNGPHGTYGNIPRATETHVEYITDLLKYMRDHAFQRIEADEAAEKKWTEHVYETAKDLLVADSAWYYGSNIPGKPKKFMFYVGGLPAYKQKLLEIAENDYEGFVLTKAATIAAAPA